MVRIAILEIARPILAFELSETFEREAQEPRGPAIVG